MAKLKTLVALDDFAAGEAIEIPEEGLAIGRERSNDIVLSDGQVSRHHARISMTPAGYLLVDAGSGNGTYLNERPVTEAFLADGDTVRVGKTLLLFVGDPGAPNPELVETTPPPIDVAPPALEVAAPPVAFAPPPTPPLRAVRPPARSGAGRVVVVFGVVLVVFGGLGWLALRMIRGVANAPVPTASVAAPAAPEQPPQPLTLHEAAEAGDLTQVKARVAEGADVNAKDARGRTPLELAALAGRSDVVSFLVSKGAAASGKNEIGMSPAELAISSGNADALEPLVTGTTDLNALLRAAAISGSTAVVERLLSRGAKPSGADEWGLTPLHLACREGNVKMVQMLLAKGADPNARTKGGVTPLQKAALSGDVEIVKALLAKGADRKVGGPDGTPYEIALGSGSFEAADLLGP